MGWLSDFRFRSVPNRTLNVEATRKNGPLSPSEEEREISGLSLSLDFRGIFVVADGDAVVGDDGVATGSVV